MARAQIGFHMSQIFAKRGFAQGDLGLECWVSRGKDYDRCVSLPASHQALSEKDTESHVAASGLSQRQLPQTPMGSVLEVCLSNQTQRVWHE